MARQAQKTKKQTVTGVGTLKSEVRVQKVPNPLYTRAHSGETWNPVVISAHVNIRESAIATLASRKHINEAQVAAADRFRSLWESIGGAGAGAFDYSREPVDGGGASEPLTERQIRAAFELKQIRQILGVRAYDIMGKIAGEGYAIQEMAASHRERTTLTDYLKDGLDEMARQWGYENRGTRRKSA